MTPVLLYHSIVEDDSTKSANLHQVSMEKFEKDIFWFKQYFDIISIDEVGYPDYLDYEGNGGVALSWWKFTLKNKKSGEIKRMNIHSQMWFNNKGKIGREDVYYNANLLN